MKRVILAALLAAIPSIATGQGVTEDRLNKAKAAFDSSNFESAKVLFTAVTNSQGIATLAQKAEAYKYLGASFALLQAKDSAKFYFMNAVEMNPFTDLDPTKFGADELAAFAQAK